MRLNSSWKAAGAIALGLALTTPTVMDGIAAVNGAPTVGDALREAGRDPSRVRLTGMATFTPQTTLENPNRIFIAGCESVGGAGGSASIPSLRAAYRTDYNSNAPFAAVPMVSLPHHNDLSGAIAALPKDCGEPYAFTFSASRSSFPTGYWPVPQGYRPPENKR